MEIKEKVFKINNKKANMFQTPIELTLHWDSGIKEYVLCQNHLFSYTYFSIEEVEDMLRILKRESDVRK
jgi:hypothetical protein